jgi:hypothetical protein
MIALKNLMDPTLQNIRKNKEELSLTKKTTKILELIKMDLANPFSQVQ